MDLTSALITYGPLGIGCLACGWAFWQERSGRTTDQISFSKTLQDVIKEYSVITSANTASNKDLEKAIYAQIEVYKESRKG